MITPSHLFMLSLAALTPRNDKAVVVVLRPPQAYVRSTRSNAQTLQQVSKILERRLRQIGIESPSITVDTTAHTLTVTIPAHQSVPYLERLLTGPGVLEFRYVKQLESE